MNSALIGRVIYSMATASWSNCVVTLGVLWLCTVVPFGVRLQLKPSKMSHINVGVYIIHVESAATECTHDRHGEERRTGKQRQDKTGNAIGHRIQHGCQHHIFTIKLK